MRTPELALVAMIGAIGSTAVAADTVKLYAAGSLRAAMTEIGDAFARAGNPRVEFVFGASGLLRDRLARGERADVFASANMEHHGVDVAIREVADSTGGGRQVCVPAPMRPEAAP